MSTLRIWIVAMLGAVASAASTSGSPFSVAASLGEEDGHATLTVRFSIPKETHLYADQISVTTTGAVKLAALNLPPPVQVHDKFTGTTAAVYQKDTTFTYAVAGDLAGGFDVTVRYQGCSDTMCFLPETKTLRLVPGTAGAVAQRPAPSAPPPAEAADLNGLLDQFNVGGRAAGYLGTQAFTTFLDNAITGRAAATGSLAAGLARRGIWLTVLLILLGGLGLNLTPCVLPMIPVNLAIIGAGARAGSRRRGFFLGGCYGLGIAAAYGALGLVVVLTKSTFGALNSNAWFNAAMAALFLVLSLGMFGILNIDLSRFQSVSGPQRQPRGAAWAAFTMGIVAALLAGACVAPAVISVLLLAGGLYAQGKLFGLALPFLLGLGMALPWPFAGAGLSFLPKPGRWMNVVKYVFAVAILALSAYYAMVASQLFRPAHYSPAAQEEALKSALRQGLTEHKPVYVDFWATWCKNCTAMDETTFKDPSVRERLSPLIAVKYQAEKPNAQPARATLDRLEVLGLPTYIVLTPK